MMPACNKGAGTNIGFPDVCNTIVGTATAPIPYPNIGANAQAMPFCIFTKICMVPGLNMQAKILMTSGMEAGTAHPMLKLPGAYTMGNPTIIMEKAPAVHLLCPTTGNNMNNALGSVLVPSVVNVLFSRADTPNTQGELTEGLLSALDNALRDTGCAACQLEAFPQLGILRPQSLSLESSTRLYQAVRSCERDGAGALLLDLRGNRGGDVRSALRIADDFLPAGTVIALQRDRLGTIEHRARRTATYDMPLTILVDGRTGSAAELLAGALQYHGRARLAGTRTFGKWSAQSLCDSGPDSPMRYQTVAEFMLPDGSELKGKGLTPDFNLPMPDAQDNDTQLHAAARLAKALSVERV